MRANKGAGANPQTFRALNNNLYAIPMSVSRLRDKEQLYLTALTKYASPHIFPWDWKQFQVPKRPFVFWSNAQRTNFNSWVLIKRDRGVSVTFALLVPRKQSPRYYHRGGEMWRRQYTPLVPTENEIPGRLVRSSSKSWLSMTTLNTHNVLFLTSGHGRKLWKRRLRWSSG